MSSKKKSSKQPPQLSVAGQTIVIGDGWAALAAAGYLALAGKEILWIKGTGARLIAPVASLESGLGSDAWMNLAQKLEISVGEPQRGSFIREFRNKAFREPAWLKAPTPEARKEVLAEVLWAPEQRWTGVFETRFEQPLSEVEESIRAALTSERFPNLRILADLPVSGIEVNEGQAVALILGSGEKLKAEQIVYADRWAALPSLTGLPKPLPFLRKREWTGALQATLNHEVAVALGVRESFFGTLHKEAGEDQDRRVWGYFSSDGKRSTWTLALSAEEAEDNHLIGKKLRRMKNALDKMFTGESWLPTGKAEFLSTVTGEQVRFEELILAADSVRTETAVELPKVRGLVFVTDADGPASSFEQVVRWLGVEFRPDTQAEAEDAALTATQLQG